MGSTDVLREGARSGRSGGSGGTECTFPEGLGTTWAGSREVGKNGVSVEREDSGPRSIELCFRRDNLRRRPGPERCSPEVHQSRREWVPRRRSVRQVGAPGRVPGGRGRVRTGRRDGSRSETTRKRVGIGSMINDGSFVRRE